MAVICSLCYEVMLQTVTRVYLKICWLGTSQTLKYKEPLTNNLPIIPILNDNDIPKTNLKMQCTFIPKRSIAPPIK